MIRVAFLCFSNPFLYNFSHNDIMLEYYDDLRYIEYEKCDLLIIANNKGKVNLVKCLELVKKRCDNKPIFIIDHEYNNEIVDTIFSLGATDYLIYPIANSYLKNKIIKAYNETKQAKLNIYEYYELKIDFNAQMVFLSQRPISLTKIEFNLLKTLISNVNIPLGKKELIKLVWGYDSDDYRTIETHIKTLRRKLKDYGNNIITIWSKGYAFME